MLPGSPRPGPFRTVDAVSPAANPEAGKKFVLICTPSNEVTIVVKATGAPTGTSSPTLTSIGAMTRYPMNGCRMVPRIGICCRPSTIGWTKSPSNGIFSRKRTSPVCSLTITVNCSVPPDSTTDRSGRNEKLPSAARVIFPPWFGSSRMV